jgi:transcriptional regulator of aromatic amino acid metabolism
MSSGDLKSRIRGRYVVNPSTGCWNWKLSTIGKGYGQLHVRHLKERFAHRVAYRAFKGDIPADTDVLHTCDNKLCVNPSHLFLGTKKDNAQDMKAKDRHLYGELNTEAKLTEKQVLQIHRLYKAGGVSTYQLADRFGVSQSTIWKILKGHRWEHVKKKVNSARR